MNIINEAVYNPEIDVRMPFGYSPRDYQTPFWEALQNGYKRIVLIWHRRAGKDVTILNATATAMADTYSQLAYGGVGNYYYFFPTFAQGKKVIWDGMTKPDRKKGIPGKKFLDFIPEKLIANKWNDEMKIRLKNGSLFQIVGTDNYDCYDNQTEILTKEGWKLFKDISDTEIVATLKNGKLVYENITAKVEYDYNGEMYHVKSKSIDMMTTPNHKYYVESRKGVYKFREIKDVNTFNDRIPATCKWEGKSPQNHQFKVIMSDWCAFMGIFLSEGSTFANHKSYRVLITQDNQSHPDIVNDIKALLKRMNLNYQYNGKNFQVENKQLYNYLKQFGKCYEKYIPRDLLELSPEYLKILKDWLIKGDGYIQKGGHEIYYSTSKKLIDDFQELVIKLGLSGNIKEKKQPVGNINGRLIYAKRKLYELFIRKSQYKYFSKTGQSYIRKEPYSGKVYCVEVPSHIIKVRRYGCEMWCGNSIMGTNPIWCVFSEYALQNPAAWDYIRPILRENKGIAIFPYTPRGHNHGYELYHNVARIYPDRWFNQLLTIDDTNVLTLEDIEEEKRDGMSEDLAQQEFYCSWNMGADGLYYAKQVAKLREDDRIIDLPIDTSRPVHTAWDIGVKDATAIVFYQMLPGRYHIVDFYENVGEGVQHYAKVLKDKGYVYGNHYGPHDLQSPSWSYEGLPAIEVARNHNIHFNIVKKVKILDGIEAGRNMLSKCYFNKSKTLDLIKHIENYSKIWSPSLNMYTSKARHDEHCHAADSWRYFSLAEKSTYVNQSNINEINEQSMQNAMEYSNEYSGL